MSNSRQVIKQMYPSIHSSGLTVTRHLHWRDSMTYHNNMPAYRDGTSCRHAIVSTTLTL